MSNKISELRKTLVPVSSKNGKGAYFPLTYITDMFKFFKSHPEKYSIITYADLPINEKEDYKENYIKEFREWCAKIKEDPEASKKAHVLIQYDIDSHPHRANTLLKDELHDDIPANVMIFRDRVDRRHLKKTGELRLTEYNFDINLMLERVQQNFLLGYHTNAYEKSQHDMGIAMEIFNDDMTYLHNTYGVKYFSAHGGIPGPNGLNNRDIHYSPDWLEKAVWVHNGYTLRFHGYFSDGGHNGKKNAPKDRDLRDFIKKMEPGKRYRMLLHPQYYGPGCQRSPTYSSTEWYDTVMDLYEEGSQVSLWNDIKPHEAFTLTS